MTSLAQLEAAARQASERYIAARDRLADAQQVAQAAIHHHATVQARFISGAGTQVDVDVAAAARDTALEALAQVERDLMPAA